MAAVPNKKIAAANGAKTARAIREDQVAPTATPGRIGSINFDQFNGPTAAAIVNEVAPPVVAPIEPPGVERALAAGAEVVAQSQPANTQASSKQQQAVDRQLEIQAQNDRFNNRTATEIAPIPETIPEWLLTTAELRARQKQQSDGSVAQPGQAAPEQILSRITTGPGRLYAPGELFTLNPPRESFFRLAEGTLDVSGATRASARGRLSRPVSLSEIEAGQAAAEQVQQGTPLTEVVAGTSPYATPGTPQADRATTLAAASGGMGAAGGGEGSGGGRVPPPRNPNDFNPDRPDRPNPPVAPSARMAGEVQLQPGLFNHLKAGYRAQAGDKTYADSVIGDTFRGRKFPEQANSSIADKAAYLGGRVGADVVGYGTRKGFWNMNPEDALGTLAREGASWAGLNGREAQLARYATAATVGLVGANYNPLNISEGGRPIGFSAVNPTEDDARKTDNPIGELLFDRAMLGRTGRLLPWEEFHQERPDVPYEKYAKYQDYIRGPSFMGLAKGTTDGIDGPEARVVGYRVQPEAVLAAAAAGAATIAAFKYGGRRL